MIIGTTNVLPRITTTAHPQSYKTLNGLLKATERLLKNCLNGIDRADGHSVGVWLTAAALPMLREGAGMIEAFHGTPYTFSHFGTACQAAHACTMKLARMPLKQFEKLTPDGNGWVGRIMRVRLHVNNPKHIADARTGAAWSRAIKKAQAEGFDSLVYSNDYEGREPADSYVVFSADQVEILDPQVNA